MKNQRGFSAVLILIAILLILGVGAGAYYFGKSNTPVPASPPPPPPSPSPSAIPTITSKVTPTSMLTATLTPTINPNSNVFTSQDLGVSFYYTKESTGGVGGTKVLVKEIGNKIYVYSASTQPESGQYLEMFAKDKNQTLIDAVKSKILTGYSLDDCLVKTISGTFSGQSYSANFELAQIGVPTTAGVDMETLSEEVKKCPAGYVAFGGLNYFLMDSTYPDKFIFLSIGQYGIGSGIGDKAWQNTIKFLP